MFDGRERAIASGRIENVFVHANQAGNYGLPGRVNYFGAGGNSNFGGCAHGGNFSVINYYGLIGFRRGSRSVNHLHMQ